MHGSRAVELHNATEILNNSFFTADREQNPKIHEIIRSFDPFGCYFWKAIVPEASNRGMPKSEIKVRRVCSID